MAYFDRLVPTWKGRQPGQSDADAAAAGATPITAAVMASLDQRVVDLSKGVTDITLENLFAGRVYTAAEINAMTTKPLTYAISETLPSNVAYAVQQHLDAGDVTDFVPQGTGVTVTLTTIGGGKAAKMTAGSGVATASGVQVQLPVESGAKYDLSLLLDSTSWAAALALDLYWYTASGYLKYDPGLTVTPGTESRKLAGSITVPATATRLGLRPRVPYASAVPAVGTYFTLRNISLQKVTA